MGPDKYWSKPQRAQRGQMNKEILENNIRNKDWDKIQRATWSSVLIAMGNNENTMLRWRGDSLAHCGMRWKLLSVVRLCFSYGNVSTKSYASKWVQWKQPQITKLGKYQKYCKHWKCHKSIADENITKYWPWKHCKYVASKNTEKTPCKGASHPQPQPYIV